MGSTEQARKKWEPGKKRGMADITTLKRRGNPSGPSAITNAGAARECGDMKGSSKDHQGAGSGTRRIGTRAKTDEDCNLNVLLPN